ncbi:MAG TPA: hypothetical protein VMV69_13855 [Pirellulales bacterium]|nr:hypothetical protein [Pirellulales bacterium]
MASKRLKCIECDAPLPDLRLRRHALTCSARCGQARQRRMSQQRNPRKNRKRCLICHKWFLAPTKRSTCSAECEAVNNQRIKPTAMKPSRQERPAEDAPSSSAGPPSNSPPSNSPPPLGISPDEAAQRIGVSRAMVHRLCVTHGLGRLCSDGRTWLTLAELRTLTVQPWKKSNV